MRRALTLAAILATGATAATPATAAAPTRLGVEAEEFRFTLSRGVVTAGSALVQLRDAGEDPHDLVVRRLDRRGRPTGKVVGFGEVAPGEVRDKRLTLEAGRYQLVCTLAGHAQAGMRATLKVVARRR
ncbi:sulfocyanin-like copper-binding protein [Conexibacter sp. SYSU D00693]|uniref:sulfocyanin-like copper-binding protein n=1 Tax=Conexibacter sp. SYSU D00693 TaxID=2812560 RepID=UPI00196A9071|nr:sulfocyanin-like copper-binding protein [Conexibacter sp. SYSU D00693]